MFTFTLRQLNKNLTFFGAKYFLGLSTPQLRNETDPSNKKWTRLVSVWRQACESFDVSCLPAAQCRIYPNIWCFCLWLLISQFWNMTKFEYWILCNICYNLFSIVQNWEISFSYWSKVFFFWTNRKFVFPVLKIFFE